MTTQQSVLIVGAGVFGAAAALELSRRGYNVSVVDQGPLPNPDSSSVDISKAVRMDYGTDEFYTRLMEEAFTGWDAWNSQADEPLYHQSGVLILTRSPMSPGTFEYESFNLLQGRGHRLERLNAKTLKARFPAWSAGTYVDGYFNPRAGWAPSGKVVAWLLQQARAAGATLHGNTPITGLAESDWRVTGVVTASGAVHKAEVVLVAAGAWTPTLLPHLSSVMEAVAQPVMYLRAPEPARYQPPHFAVWTGDVSNTGWYGFPALPDGTLKMANHGPGRPVHPNEPRRVPENTEANLRRFLGFTFPELADAPLIKSWACLYCDTWDGDFWIDHDPERPGLLVATGGSGHAFKFAPVIGGLIADVLEQKSNPYAGRFAWRARGEASKEDARYTG